MVRRYRRQTRYPRRVKAVKYSNETATCYYSIPTDVASGTNYSRTIIAATDTQGMRKVKNFTLNTSFAQIIDVSSPPVNILWALVYVPGGTSVSQIAPPTGDTVLSLYEPNQNVIMSGLLTPNQPPQVVRSRLARNLNSDDSIVLVICPDRDVGTLASDITCSLNYAITY